MLFLLLVLYVQACSVDSVSAAAELYSKLEKTDKSTRCTLGEFEQEKVTNMLKFLQQCEIQSTYRKEKSILEKKVKQHLKNRKSFMKETREYCYRKFHDSKTRFFVTKFLRETIHSLRVEYETIVYNRIEEIRIENNEDGFDSLELREKIRDNFFSKNNVFHEIYSAEILEEELKKAMKSTKLPALQEKVVKKFDFPPIDEKY